MAATRQGTAMPNRTICQNTPAGNSRLPQCIGTGGRGTERAIAFVIPPVIGDLIVEAVKETLK
jgi:hypothetical protein